LSSGARKPDEPVYCGITLYDLRSFVKREIGRGYILILGQIIASFPSRAAGCAAAKTVIAGPAVLAMAYACGAVTLSTRQCSTSQCISFVVHFRRKNEVPLQDSSMRFEWDERKNQINIRERGLDFADAEIVFEGATFTFDDDRFDYGEERFITLGMFAGEVVVIAHTERGENVRIISMRKATRYERRLYFQSFRD
jgi:uncharacterized DUF497 family protein